MNGVTVTVLAVVSFFVFKGYEVGRGHDFLLLTQRREIYIEVQHRRSAACHPPSNFSFLSSSSSFSLVPCFLQSELCCPCASVKHLMCTVHRRRRRGEVLSATQPPSRRDKRSVDRHMCRVKGRGGWKQVNIWFAVSRTRFHAGLLLCGVIARNSPNESVLFTPRKDQVVMFHSIKYYLKSLSIGMSGVFVAPSRATGICVWNAFGDYARWPSMASRGDNRRRKMGRFPVSITSKGILASVLAAGWWVSTAESWAVSSTPGFSAARFVERGTVTRGGQGQAERTSSDSLPGALGT